MDRRADQVADVALPHLQERLDREYRRADTVEMRIRAEGGPHERDRLILASDGRYALDSARSNLELGLLERSHYALKLGTRLLDVAIDFAPLMVAVAASDALAIFADVAKTAKVEARAGSGAVAELANFDEALRGAGDVLDSANNARPVSTPWGEAIQATSGQAIVARAKVESKQTIYRIGTRGTSQTGTKAQFWSLEHPSTPGYADRHGIKIDNVKNADFIETAEIKDGTEFITRHAPGWGDAKGGAVEVVVPEGGVRINSHSSLETGWWQ